MQHRASQIDMHAAPPAAPRPLPCRRPMETGRRCPPLLPLLAPTWRRNLALNGGMCLPLRSARHMLPPSRRPSRSSCLQVCCRACFASTCNRRHGSTITIGTLACLECCCDYQVDAVQLLPSPRTGADVYLTTHIDDGRSYRFGNHWRASAAPIARASAQELLRSSACTGMASRHAWHLPFLAVSTVAVG